MIMQKERRNGVEKEEKKKDTQKKCFDTVWRYDREKDMFFVLSDDMFPELEHKWHDVDGLAEFFKSNCLFDADHEIWENYLGSEGLKRICASKVETLEFSLRFYDVNGRGPQWHEVIVEHTAPGTLMVSSKNIYDKIKECALLKTTERVFDNIFYIDAESRNYMIHYPRNNSILPRTRNNYETSLEKIARGYVMEDEIEPFIHDMKLDNVCRKLEKKDSYILYATVRGRDGRMKYKKAVFSYLDDTKKIIVLIIVDVTDIVREYEHKINKYRKESYRDALTGAYNRRYFEDKIKKLELQSGVAIIDMDDFKLCNDTFGHAAGDAALVTLVNTIKQCINENDVVVRYGGDEFILILPGADEKMLEHKLQKIQNKVYKTPAEGYPGMKISVSIGGVVQRDETIEDAAGRADKLMYRAKNHKNMVVTENSALRGEGESGLLFDSEEIKQQILIVDDSEMNRAILTQMLESDFRILEASNGEECLEMLRQYGTGISLILLDIVMPVMDGFDVLTFMNKNNMIEDIPVIMISGEDSDTFIRRAYGLGVSDYISRPFDAKVVYRRVFNMIKLYSKQRKLISIVTGQAHEREKNNRMMVDILSRIVEFRNGESGLHVLHMNMLTGMILESLLKKTDKYNLSWNDRSMIITAAALHDIGKIGIDEKILNKPGKLTDEEFEIMKKHTVLGAEMLEGLTEYKNEKLVKTAIEICRWHHERYDGTGYPDGLSGDEIPISAQVVALADVYDALTSKRVYKKAYAPKEAVQMILNGECGKFNPLLLDCLADISGEIEREMKNN